jgi:multidrug transporter EmrE-like cation transporter
VLDASDRWIGFIGTTQSLMLLVGYAIWRHQSRTRGAGFVLATAMFGYALYPAALSTTHVVAIAAVLAGLGAVFSSGVNLAIFDRLMSTVPPGYGVTFNSIDTTVVYTAGVVSPIAAAALANRVGIGGALLAGAAIGLLAAVLFALHRSPQAAPAGAPAEGSATG